MLFYSIKEKSQDKFLYCDLLSNANYLHTNGYIFLEQKILIVIAPLFLCLSTSLPV